MKIKVQNTEMDNKKDKVESVRVSYRIEQDEENLSGTGKFDVKEKDYEGALDKLKEKCAKHFKDNIGELDYQIRSTDMKYDGDDVDSVTVVFKAKKGRELSVRGNFDLDADDYEDNSSTSDLKDMAKKYLEDEADDAA